MKTAEVIAEILITIYDGVEHEFARTRFQLH